MVGTHYGSDFHNILCLDYFKPCRRKQHISLVVIRHSFTNDFYIKSDSTCCDIWIKTTKRRLMRVAVMQQREFSLCIYCHRVSGRRHVLSAGVQLNCRRRRPVVLFLLQQPFNILNRFGIAEGFGLIPDGTRDRKRKEFLDVNVHSGGFWENTLADAGQHGGQIQDDKINEQPFVVGNGVLFQNRLWVDDTPERRRLLKFEP
jgi:hypothetical protein